MGLEVFFNYGGFRFVAEGYRNLDLPGSAVTSAWHHVPVVLGKPLLQIVGNPGIVTQRVGKRTEFIDVGEHGCWVDGWFAGFVCCCAPNEAIWAGLPGRSLERAVGVVRPRLRAPCGALRRGRLRLLLRSKRSLAEGVGFEPTGPLRALQFSRLAQSTTLPPLHGISRSEISPEPGRKSSKSIGALLKCGFCA